MGPLTQGPSPQEPLILGRRHPRARDRPGTPLPTLGSRQARLDPTLSLVPDFGCAWSFALNSRGNMTPSNSKATLAHPETLSIRPRYCPQCSEFEGASPNQQRHSGPADNLSPGEIYKAANLTVFASNRQRPDQPVQLDFHFTRGSQGATHWHGLLKGRTLFLDTPHLALDFNSRESLTATLEYAEEKTDVKQVLVNFHKSRRDRGDLLRAFGFLGFQLVPPDHPALPPWEDTIFMAYPLERDLGWEQQREDASRARRQDGGAPMESLSGAARPGP
ncbi:LOW QUALITY PROTEIN: ornithine decarboxylase antizyme 3 [Candoia aspera]|uniref:LOW QUALITY PROTEIN: ornithine decarboxylase antizyme 3 n=1 Tax=Candoia aspera TaxID=51853 RepID=UPI002FD80403